MRTVLVSTYEMGHQPLALASAAAALRAAGHEVGTLDLSVEAPEVERFEGAGLVAISIPMHTAARLGIELARRLRRLRPKLHIAFYGLYATPLHDRLTRDGLADSVVGGEYEPGLVALADQLAGRRPAGAPLEGVGAVAAFARQQHPVPDRSGLPPLEAYARLRVGDEERLAGYTEATRGCAHLCTHCPITPVYGGRLRLVRPEAVLADIEQQVAAGARHITFGDPDFLNARPHSMAIAQEVHRRHPDLTFDATIKVEHLLEHADVLPALSAAGCLFITSAFESTSDAILRALQKGHTRDDMERALGLAQAAGLVLRPTWVAHTPWATGDDFLELLAFIEGHGLVEVVQPVQYALRLLLPPGSPLIERLRVEQSLGPFEEEGLTWQWSSADPRLDRLQAELAGIVEAASCAGCDPEPAVETFRRVKAATYRHLLDDHGPVEVAPQPRRVVPGLTESWFC
ncbi:MAG: radical SAM protein [Dehalococcoidia bacterium]|nr:radical SAM protein [Dehalococcoidia bacterium]